MFFRLFPRVMIDRKRLCLSGGSSVRNLRAAGPLFYIRESCVFFRHPGAESSSVFLISAALRGKVTGRLAGAPMRREPHAPPRPGVFRLRRLPSLRLRKTVLWVSSVRRSRRGFIREDSRTRGRSAGRFFSRPRGVSESRFPSVRWRGKSRVSSPVSFREKTAHFCWTDGGFIIPGVHFFRLSC